MGIEKGRKRKINETKRLGYKSVDLKLGSGGTCF